MLLFPAIGPVVGDNVHWLSFWGSYLAALLPTVGAFMILYIQRRDSLGENEKRRKENEDNRNLQINILKYQQEMQWLNENREILIDCVCALDKDHLIEVAHKLECKKDITLEVKAILDNLLKNDSRVAFMQVSHRTEEYNTFNDKRSAAYVVFRDALLDLQEINILFQLTGFNKREIVLHERLQRKHVHRGLQRVISRYSNIQDFIQLNVGDVSALLLSVTPNLLEDTREAALAYIKSEERRISKLLITVV